jgi:ankyrin repeat protein
MLAAKDGDVATVEKLLIAGAKVDRDAIYDNQEAAMLITPLFAAAAASHAAVISVLLKAGAKINRTTAGGLPPRFASAQLGHRAAVSVLVKTGTEIDIMTDE